MSDDENKAAPEAENPEPSDATEDSSNSLNAEASGDRETGEDTAREGEKPEGVKRKSGLEKRFSELTGKLSAAQAAIEARDQEIERMYRILERGGTVNQAAGRPSEDIEPDRGQFEDYEDYLVARAEWAGRQAFRKEHEKAEGERRADNEKRAQAETEQRWAQSHAAAAETHDDYLEMFDAVGTSITPEVAGAIKMADEPGEVVYWLGKNPKALERVSGMKGAALIREVGRIEERLTSERKAASKAPKPPDPIKGDAAPTMNPLDMRQSMDSWAKKRREQRTKAATR